MRDNPYKSPEAEGERKEPPTHKPHSWIFTGDRFFDVGTSIFLLALVAMLAFLFLSSLR